QVVLDGVLEGGDLADGLTDGEVLLEPLGSALGQVGDRAQQLIAAGEDRGRLGLEALDVSGELLDLGQQLLLLLTLGRRDPFAEGLLLGAGGLEGGGGLAPAGVGLEHGVDDDVIAAPSTLGLTDDVGVLAQSPQIEQCTRVPALRVGSTLAEWTSPCC